eukprot:6189096-Pleurochrysis_carterae.AAC.2
MSLLIQSRRVATPATDKTKTLDQHHAPKGTPVRATTRSRAGRSNSGVRVCVSAFDNLRATPCCAGGQPAACGIAELEYGNHILRAISTYI